MLQINDHRRDSAGLLYVYPVVSRRAGGVSVGVNLNVNNACNWACVYCQVEGLTRGGPPPIDIDRLALELRGFLEQLRSGDFMRREVPESARRLVDVAFSGNGEPTSAAEFDDAVSAVLEVLSKCGLIGQIPVRLITNGSLMHRPNVQAGIRALGAAGGEVWFKVDRATPGEVELINGVPMDEARLQKNLLTSCSLCPTWIQTCWFAMDGEPPSSESRAAYCRLIKPLATHVKGVLLYGLARPSQQPAAPRLQALDESSLMAFAEQIKAETGIPVRVSP